MHRRNNLVLLCGVERVQHGARLLLRTLFHWCEQFAAARSEREMTLAPIFGRGLAADQAAFFEIAQKAAKVAGVELKRPANVRCGDVIRLRNLIEHPHLAERIGAVEVGLAQYTDLPRVKAIETTYGRNCLLARHRARVDQLVD